MYFSFSAFSIQNMNHMNNKCRNQIKNTLAQAAHANPNYNVNYCFVHKVTCVFLFWAGTVCISSHIGHGPCTLHSTWTRTTENDSHKFSAHQSFWCVPGYYCNYSITQSRQKRNSLTPASSFSDGHVSYSMHSRFRTYHELTNNMTRGRRCIGHMQAIELIGQCLFNVPRRLAQPSGPIPNHAH